MGVWEYKTNAHSFYAVVNTPRRPLVPAVGGPGRSVAAARSNFPVRREVTRMRVEILVVMACCIGACDNGLEDPTGTPPPGPQRSWRMGFSAIPPKPNEQILLSNP